RFVALFRRGSEYGCEEAQVLLNREVLVQGELSRHVAQARANLPHVVHNVQPQYRCASRVRNEKCAQNPEQCSLAGTIRSHQPEQFGRLHLERDTSEGNGVTEPLLDLVNHHWWLARRDAHGDSPLEVTFVQLTSAGIPILSAPLSLGTRIFTAYTRSARSSRVCTGVGVNSAEDAIHDTVPGYSRKPASVPVMFTVTC